MAGKQRSIAQLNKLELENAISPNASWHTDYRDTAFIFIANLDHRLSEGDVATIFSQYGEPVFLKLARDRDTGKSKGYGWLKYEDQRSCDLAVDNMGGAEVLGRKLGVDHARYKMREEDGEGAFDVPGADEIRSLEGEDRQRYEGRDRTPEMLGARGEKKRIEDGRRRTRRRSHSVSDG